MPIEGWPPDTCEMPDLSNLNPKLILNLAALRFTGKYNLADPKTYRLVMSYLRLLDKLVDEYHRTRNTLTEFVTTPGDVMSPLIFATNHCESLLTTMVRVIKVGNRIRKDRNGPPIAKKIPVLTDAAVWTRVNDMRCAIEHIDDEIAGNGNTWNPDEPSLVILKKDRLFLIGQEITYAELAEWVRQLHAVGTDLSTYETP